MTEYIINLDGELGLALAVAAAGAGFSREEIVRCRDCKHYYEAEEYNPRRNYDRRCCKYFDAYYNEVEPDGYCKWGARREEPEQTCYERTCNLVEDEIGLLHCSNCGGAAEKQSWEYWVYCPKCGYKVVKQ